MTQTPEEREPFKPNDHVIQLKSKSGSADYLPVQWRLVWFREQCPHGTIDTEEIEVDLDREMEEEVYAWNNETRRSEKVMKRAKGYARYKATVTDGKGGRATGTKSEKAVSFPDFVEKSETGAIGRALAALGYGTSFAPDLDEGSRIADAPVERTPHDTTRPSAPVTRSRAPETDQDVNKSKHTQNQETDQESRPGGTQTVLQRMIEQAKGRSEKLGIAWDRVKGDSLGEQVLDEKLVTTQFTKINGYLAKKERGEAA